MIDEALRVWLIEINVSPDVSHGTKVTSELVPVATKDTLNGTNFRLETMTNTHLCIQLF
jgi:hypothetical protein